MALQHLRSSTANKRPIPTAMSAGQIAINTNEGSPGLFFKDSNGDLVKVGPVHIGTSAPNSTPDSLAATALVTGTVYQVLTVGNSDFTLVGASANTVGTVFTATGTTTGTGTVSGQQGNEKGEQWLDTTGSTFDLKIYDGNAWRSTSSSGSLPSVGTAPNEIPVNQYLGQQAFVDEVGTVRPSASEPQANKDINFQYVSDTSIKIRMRGADGTVRSTTLTLS